ncbi:benzoyl-CoA 2,3-epoxidase subunit BoxA [Novosphingobium piscinae]|uniref:Benzoyl-CoA 2,3-epoxidase subunit BoxA n=1 Tax=Novosphingobium piscinae TaxID=1507448 RepID=A0A7X1KQ95_9SPHN|nr:benzoyl-CoA 2,3-epoxidase subunit BoxA [Novosphingobium piscinae]MBC2669300.1 benzoyl-CoA 2,3-epoxidase subunit BoxA [Novosphingobium piscinae]
MGDVAVLKQHLIDPEICIRCNSCEAACPSGAITHDDNNYVVNAGACDFGMSCLPVCPTGAIDNWRLVPSSQAYSIEQQFGWTELPAELSPELLASQGVPEEMLAAPPEATSAEAGPTPASAVTTRLNAHVPPWSAAHPYVSLYGPRAREPWIEATVAGNVRVTNRGSDYDTHHVVLDFGARPFPVLEGQSIGILPPGADDKGRPHHARQYSVASARTGERSGFNNLSLTIKRVLEDHQGRPVRGVASNYMCDLEVGDKVRVTGPFGATFLMPNHPRSNIVMICTGTGSAPMRAMTEWRRRLHKSGRFEGGKLMLFFGARSPEELPYFGPLKNLPRDLLDVNLAFSRVTGQPKRYVQDVMRERAADLAPLLGSPDTAIFVCGLRGMEEGVIAALRDIAIASGLDWDALGTALRDEGRIHFETY